MNSVRFLFQSQYQMRYRKDEASLRYPNGAVLILCTIDDGEYICASSKYDPSIDYSGQLIKQQYLQDYFLTFSKKKRNKERPIAKHDYSVMIVPPIERTSITLSKLIPCSMEYFYLEHYYSIRHIFDACCKRYPDCSEDTFQIAYCEYGEDNVLYLGYTLDRNPDISEIESLLGRRISFFSKAKLEYKYQKYVEKNFYNKKNPREDKDQARQRSFLLNTIHEWILTTPYSSFQEAIHSRVKGQPELDLVLANIYTYLNTLVKGKKPYKSNMILSAPSGSGKTETFRALRDYFASSIPTFPVLQIDLSPYTESGYRGKNKDEIEKIIAEKSAFGIGIVFFDELDKKIIPSYGSSGINYNAALLAELLTMLEGSIITDNNGKTLFDSSYTLFIGLGSFDVVREKKQKEASKKLIGFEAKSPLSDYDHYNDITLDDIIELGTSYEFVGRFTLFANYRKLATEHILEIIDSITTELSEALQVKIILSEQMKAFLLREANGNFGCRRIRSIIEMAVYPKYSAYLNNANFAPCVLKIDAPNLD